MKSFAKSSSWKTYKSILESEFGISLEMEPSESFVNIRGHNIRLDEWKPEGKQLGTVILVHGGGGNGRVLAPFAEPLASNGWKVLAPDLPGYGLSIPAKVYRGEYSEWLRVIAEVADRQEGEVALVGYSMGGLSAVLASQNSDKVGAVVATTLLDLSDKKTFVSAARTKLLGRLSLIGIKLAPWLFDRLRLPLSLVTPLNSMSSNHEMQRYFVQDLLIGASWKPAAFFRSVHQYKVSSLKLECPLLLVHPGKDDWTPTALSLKVFNEIVAKKSFVELSNGSHLPLEQPAYKELNEAVLKFLEEELAR
jgi:pimeloyl-ACP methyl ester carboxylesterase